MIPPPGVCVLQCKLMAHTREGLGCWVESMIKTLKYFVLRIGLYCINVHIVHYTKKGISVGSMFWMHLKYILIYTLKVLPCAISVCALISIYCDVLEWRCIYYCEASLRAV